MWKLFKRTGNTANGPTARDKAAEYISVTIIRRQKQFADWLQLKSERLSLRAKKGVLIIFFALGTGYFLDLIFFRDSNAHFPYSAGNFFTPRLQPTSRIPEAAVQDSVSLLRIRKFKRHLDSLNTTEEGRQEAMRLLEGRVGLLDTLNRLDDLLK